MASASARPRHRLPTTAGHWLSACSNPPRHIADGTNNNVVAIDGSASTNPSTENNNVFTVLGQSELKGDAHDNNVVNVGGKVTIDGQGTNTPGVTSLSACGTQFTGQAAYVTVSNGVC